MGRFKSKATQRTKAYDTNNTALLTRDLRFLQSLLLSKNNFEPNLKGTSRYNEQKMDNGKTFLLKIKGKCWSPEWKTHMHANFFRPLVVSEFS